jgi:radical SAM superfamily enzyme YgiQ (UPF0313 family)
MISPRVLLIVPPFPDRTYPGKTMGPDYLAGALDLADGTLDIYDADVRGQRGLEACLESTGWDIVGITNMSFQADQANDIARMVRTTCPKAIIVKGGAHETAGSELTLSLHGEYVDICVIGEGEETFKRVVEHVGDGNLSQSLPNIAGIAWRSNGEVISNPYQPRLYEVNDSIPRRLYFDESYNFPIFGGRKTAQMMTVRGCQHRCFFCSESTGARCVRRRGEESLRAELEELRRERYEAIYIDDATFTDDRKHALLVAHLMSEYGFVWGCNTRVDALDEELVFEMSACGCVYVFCGIESMVPGVLLGLNKTRKPVEYVQAAKGVYGWLREAGVPCGVFLIFGGPKVEYLNGKAVYSVESWQDIQTTLRQVFTELHPDFVTMNVLRFLPGVPHSFAPKFAYIRPNEEVVHAGFYDQAWYRKLRRPDLRSTHDIYDAFEGKHSVNPPHVSVELCYRALSEAMRLANEHLDSAGRPVEIVSGKDFADKYVVRNDKHYRLAPLGEMSQS